MLVIQGKQENSASYNTKKTNFKGLYKNLGTVYKFIQQNQHPLNHPYKKVDNHPLRTPHSPARTANSADFSMKKPLKSLYQA